MIAEVDIQGAPHLVKFSRYHSQPAVLDRAGRAGRAPAGARHGHRDPEPEPDEYELYDLTLDPLEQRNLAHPAFADDAPRETCSERRMSGSSPEQIEAKRLVPSAAQPPGYRPPARRL